MSPMRIYHQPALSPRPKSQPPTPPPAESKMDDWLGAAFAVSGGLLSVTGAYTGNSLALTGGTVLTAVGTTMAAYRVQTQGGVDAASLTAFVGGGVLTATALTLLAQPTAPSTPNGPLPQLLERLGIPRFG